MKKYLLVCLACLSLAGCSFSMPNYSVRNKNLTLTKQGKKAISIVEEKPGFNDDGSILCRAAGPIKAPSGQSFSGYITDALKSELSANKLLDQNSSNKMRVKVKRVDFSSALGATNWYIDADYRIERKVISISTVYHDRSSYLATKACNNIARYFQKAVAEHLRQLYSRPEFKTAIGIGW